MSSLRDYLLKGDTGVRSTGHGLHIGVALAENLISVAKALLWLRREIRR